MEEKFGKNRRNQRELDEIEQLKNVEMFISGTNCAYRFKIWGNARTSMFVAIKEDSDIVGNLKVGDIFSMKFFNPGSGGGFKNLDTEIKYFNKIDFGRFKGHYLAGLSIL